MADIKFISPFDADFSALMEIRKEVFINEQGAVASQEFDLYDDITSGAYFVGAYVDGVVVGTGRLIISSKYKIGRVAVKKEYRGNKIGSQIVETLLNKAVSLGAEKVYVDSQPHAVALYESFGFEVFAKDIIDRGLEHMPMVKVIEKDEEE